MNYSLRLETNTTEGKCEVRSANSEVSGSNLGSAKVAAVVLAAGSSSRLGRPKQLLEWEGSPLLFHLTLQAILSKAQRTMVVLGYEIGRLAQILIGLDALVIENPNWREGVSSSIRRAVEVANSERIDGLLFMTSDQPLVTTDTLNRLLEACDRSGKTIAASQYDDTLGVPALFLRPHFPELLELTGDRGAQRIIARHPAQVEAVPFPGGAVDIDTAEDLRQIPNPSDANSPD